MLLKTTCIDVSKVSYRWIIRLSFAAMMVIALLTTSCTRQGDADQSSSNSTTAVDVCALITTEKIETLLEDTIRNPRSGPAAGITLGSCTWAAENNGRILSIWAASNERWDQLVERDGVGSIEGLGARAEKTEEGGLYVDPGKGNYFLQAFVIDTNGSVNLELGMAGARLAIN